MKIKKLEMMYNNIGFAAHETFYDVNFRLTKSIFQEMWDTANVTEKEMIMQVVDSNRPDDKDDLFKEKSILVLEQLKRLTGNTFRAFNTKGRPTKNLKLVMYLLKDGRELRDIIAVIDYKAKQWLFNSKMKKYLRPETLFNPTKFEAYLNEVGK